MKIGRGCGPTVVKIVVAGSIVVVQVVWGTSGVVSAVGFRRSREGSTMFLLSNGRSFLSPCLWMMSLQGVLVRWEFSHSLSRRHAVFWDSLFSSAAVHCFVHSVNDVFKLDPQRV